MNMGAGTTCGGDAWFAYEYWADGPECEIPLWNGPAESAIAEKARSMQEAERIVTSDDE